jgi:glutaredoxin-like protein NrdH
MSAVTVWSKKPCPQCDAVKRQFKRDGVEFEEFNLLEHPEIVEEFKARGLSSAPVVFASGLEPFAGFQPDAVKAVIAAHGTK